MADPTATAGVLDRIETPEFFEDPYPVYAAMREISPVLSFPDGSLVLTGYDEVYGALRDHETFSSATYGGGPPLGMIGEDPPRHTRLRNLVNRGFTPRRVAVMEPWIRELVGGIADGFAAGEVDVVDEVAVPLPITVIAKLLGVPAADRGEFKRWSDALIMTTRSEAEAQVHGSAMGEMSEYFLRVIADRRGEPLDDLVSALTGAEIDGERLDDGEILGMAVLLLVAGNETTTNLIGNVLGSLAERPDLWERLAGGEVAVDDVVEESLRIDSPVQLLNRVTKRPVTLAGEEIAPGTMATVVFGAANRDPKEFPEPDEFRTDRELGRHVAFGYGIHYCLGAPLARQEARVVIETLLERGLQPRPGSEPGVRQSASIIVRGYERLPLRLG